MEDRRTTRAESGWQISMRAPNFGNESNAAILWLRYHSYPKDRRIEPDRARRLSPRSGVACPRHSESPANNAFAWIGRMEQRGERRMLRLDSQLFYPGFYLYGSSASFFRLYDLYRPKVSDFYDHPLAGEFRSLRQAIERTMEAEEPVDLGAHRVLAFSVHGATRPRDGCYVLPVRPVRSELDRVSYPRLYRQAIPHLLPGVRQPLPWSSRYKHLKFGPMIRFNHFGEGPARLANR